MDATPTPSPHEAQRDRILDTALALFRQHGVKAVTMDDVAHALTMSKRTLYQTFRDKEDLLLEAVKKSRRTELEEMESIAQEKDNVLEILLTAMDRRMKELETIAPAFFADIVKYGRVIDYLDACERDDTEKVVGFLRRGVAQGYFRNDVDLYLFYDMLGTLRFAERTVEDSMVSDQIERDVRALVDHLPAEQREVVMLRYFSGLSFKDIAEQTDVSINTALGRMRYALINLRRMIKEKNLILS